MKDTAMNNASEILPGSTRVDILKVMESNSGLIGIELGVAEGYFAKTLLDTGVFKQLWGVDMYADWHDVEQYKRALVNCDLNSNYKLVRMTFDQALDMFPDNYFDFIYVDGYASSGEMGGATIHQWFKKLKVGGLMAGDDYHSDWPLVVKSVDDFVEQTGFKMYLTEQVSDAVYSQYPTWGVIKRSEVRTSENQDLVKEGSRAQKRQEMRYLVKMLLIRLGLWRN